MTTISDQILVRELGSDAEGRRARIIGKRLHDGYIHYKRYLEILNVVSKNGFGYLFDRIKNINNIPKLEDTKGSVKNFPEAVRLRLVFEELGPTFIKIGQILSTRPDLVPIEFAKELGNLRDKVAPIPITDVKKTVEKELGKKTEKLFSKFYDQPIGSASIGQVHKAITMEKRVVAVKVQRSDVKEKILADLEILEDISESFGDLIGLEGVIDPLEMVKEFKRLLTREIDYTIEARSIEHFYTDFNDVDQVIIPKIYWELTTKRVLTMDFITGIDAGSVSDLKKQGLDTDKLAVTIGTAVARMIFVKGFFHGDPHGGNIFIQKDGKIAFLDFGSIGYLDGKMRDYIRLFYFAIARENVSRASEIFFDICKVSESKINRPAFEQDLKEFLDFQKLSKKGYKIPEGMNQRLVSIALKHNFAPPANFLLLERALLEAEGVCRELSPKFDFNQMLTPILKDVIQEKVDGALDPIGTLKTAQEYRELVQKGPKRISSILNKVDSGELVVKVDTSFMDEVRTDIWKMFLITMLSFVSLVSIIAITFTGLNLETPVFNLSITTTTIVILWLIGCWWVYRRWDGPK